MRFFNIIAYAEELRKVIVILLTNKLAKSYKRVCDLRGIMVKRINTILMMEKNIARFNSDKLLQSHMVLQWEILQIMDLWIF